MSRPPRFTYAKALHHVSLRCNNREFLFEEASFRLFLATLQETRAKYPIALYNYCLMTNHVHVLFRVGTDDALPKAMHWLSSTFVHRFNLVRNRKGHLWEGRYRSTLIDKNSSFFRCMAYMDLNPIRAGMVADTGEYPWSTHRALRDHDTTAIDLHPLYLALGTNTRSRYRIYSEIVADEAQRPPFTLATQYFMGTPAFVQRMAKRFGLSARRNDLRQVDLGGGVVVSGPVRGRRFSQEPP